MAKTYKERRLVGDEPTEEELKFLAEFIKKAKPSDYVTELDLWKVLKGSKS